eukprot:s853_g18.t1
MVRSSSLTAVPMASVLQRLHLLPRAARGRRGLCACAAHSQRVRRIYGSRGDALPGFSLPLDEARDWPGEYPLQLCRHAFGIDLGVSGAAFRRQMFDAVEEHLTARPHGPADHAEWIRTGRSNDNPPEFVALAIPPRTAFFVHQHPGIELVFLLRGSMSEVRLEDPPHIHRDCKEAKAPFDLRNPEYRFARRTFNAGKEGRWLANEVGSIHQPLG